MDLPPGFLKSSTMLDHQACQNQDLMASQSDDHHHPWLRTILAQHELGRPFRGIDMDVRGIIVSGQHLEGETLDLQDGRHRDLPILNQKAWDIKQKLLYFKLYHIMIDIFIKLWNPWVHHRSNLHPGAAGPGSPKRRVER
jgi:hypothetical protein